MRKLAIITTHPIQYYAPIFKLLHERGKIEIMVFYTWGEKVMVKYDPGFGKQIAWDIPVLEGYTYQWVQNTSADPGTHHFKGIITPGLVKQVKDWQADAVLVFGWAFDGHLKAMKYFKGKIPVYFRGDSTLLDGPEGIRKLLKTLFLKRVYSYIDHAFYTGTNNKAYFKKFGLKDKQLTFAPHAVDNERFSQDKSQEALALRKKLGITPKDVLVLFAGKLENKKSPIELLEAFLALKKPEAHLLIVGNGELEQVLKRKAAGEKNVRFMDFKNQTIMPGIYQACDLFCLPSKGPGETWGLAVNEAMACGKAILVSDKVGCAVDLVKEKYNGSIFKSGDSGDLQRKLDALVSSKEKLTETGKNSASTIKDWNFTRITDAIEGQLINDIP